MLNDRSDVFITFFELDYNPKTEGRKISQNRLKKDPKRDGAWLIPRQWENPL